MGLRKRTFVYVDDTKEKLEPATKPKFEIIDDLSEISFYLAKGGYIWLDFDSPTAEDLNVLIKPLGLHALAIEDCVNEEQYPKFDRFPDHSFLIINDFEYTKGGGIKDNSLGKLVTKEIDCFLAKQYVITIHKGPLIPGQSNSEDFVENFFTDELLFRGPDFLLHKIIDAVVDQKFDVIESLQDEISLEEELIFKQKELGTEKLIKLRKILIQARKSIVYEKEVLTKIISHDCPYVSPEAILYYKDIFDHLTKYYDFIDLLREEASGLLELHLSVKNHRLAHASNQINQTVKRLTVITTIFMPLTLLAGIGGMSEWSMITGPNNWHISYPLFTLFMVIIGLVNYQILRKIKWL